MGGNPKAYSLYYSDPQVEAMYQRILRHSSRNEVNLPGTKGTVIKKAVPSGGDRALHFVRLKPVISPNVGDSGAQFLVGGDCVRASPKQY